MAVTLVERTAAVFRAKPNQWIDAHEFAKVGGFAGFTARIRDLRKARYGGLVIENRTRRVAKVWGTETISEYRWVIGESRATEKAS